MEATLSIDWTLFALQVVQTGVVCFGLWLLLLRPVRRQVERRRRMAIRTEGERNRARAALKDVQAKRVEILNKAREEARALKEGREQETVKEETSKKQEREALLLLEERFARKEPERRA